MTQNSVNLFVRLIEEMELELAGALFDLSFHPVEHGNCVGLRACQVPVSLINRDSIYCMQWISVIYTI